MTDELKPYTPTLDERLRSFVAKSLYGEGRNALYKAAPINNAIGLSPVGILTSAYDAGRKIGSGIESKDVGEIGAGAVGLGLDAAPGVGLLKTLVKRYAGNIPWSRLGPGMIERVWREQGADLNKLNAYERLFWAKPRRGESSEKFLQKINSSDEFKDAEKEWMKLGLPSYGQDSTGKRVNPYMPDRGDWNKALTREMNNGLDSRLEDGSHVAARLGTFADDPATIRNVQPAPIPGPTLRDAVDEHGPQIIPWEYKHPHVIEKVWSELGADLNTLNSFWKGMDVLKTKRVKNLSIKDFNESDLGTKYNDMTDRFMEIWDPKKQITFRSIPTYQDWIRSVKKSGMDPNEVKVGDFLGKPPPPPESPPTNRGLYVVKDNQ